MIFKKSLWVLLFILPLISKGQTSQLSAGEIKLGIQKLDVTGSVLYIAAHPDDENTKLLTWLSKARKVRTGYLSLTRGDGGQNLIGTEQAEELGLIRTQELLAARKIDGAEQFFARAIDFGYSKTADETLRIWNKDLILSDVVRVIRKFRPDVIITRFPADSRAGHGNHTASAMLAIEAYTAAADPKQFTALGHPWQVKRVLWNTFNFGGNNTTSADQLQIDVGGYNALLGKSYGELAAQSRSQHKTQGFGSASQRGPEFEYFSLLIGSPAKKDLFDDIDITWKRVANNGRISALINKISTNFEIVSPAKSVPDLLLLRTLLSKIDDDELRDKKVSEVDELIFSCAAIWFEISAIEPEVSSDDSIRVRIQAISLMQDVLQLPVSLSECLSGMSSKLLSDKLLTVDTKIGQAKLTQPYWLTTDRTVGSYNNSPGDMSQPDNDPPAGIFSVKIGDQVLEVSRTIFYKYTDPVKGEIYQPLAITPPVTISPESKMIFPGNVNNLQLLKVKVTAKKDNVKGSINLKTDGASIISGQAKSFDLKKKGDITYVELSFQPAGSAENIALSLITMSADINGQTYSFDEKAITYDHLPKINYFPAAEFKFLQTDLKTTGKRLAYLPGAGDRITDALKLMGYSVDVLTDDQVLTNDLSVYEAIIAGVRIYNVKSDIDKLYPRLMEFVKNGGTYLVQYNVSNGLKSTEIGPYPFKINNSRITDEDARINILTPSHQVLNYPNKITTEDFNNWVQERGLYFVTDYERNYTAIFGMKDPGEAENKGSLITADYGKGRFVYTSLSFFRQLPAGIPGAYRLFVNLIAKRQ